MLLFLSKFDHLLVIGSIIERKHRLEDHYVFYLIDERFSVELSSKVFGHPEVVLLSNSFDALFLPQTLTSSAHYKYFGHQKVFCLTKLIAITDRISIVKLPLKVSFAFFHQSFTSLFVNLWSDQNWFLTEWVWLSALELQIKHASVQIPVKV